jgi:hypothetical protein
MAELSDSYEHDMRAALTEVQWQLREQNEQLHLANRMSALMLVELEHLRTAQKEKNTAETALSGSRLTKLVQATYKVVLGQMIDDVLGPANADKDIPVG